MYKPNSSVAHISSFTRLSGVGTKHASARKFARMFTNLCIAGLLTLTANSSWALDLKTVLDNTAVEPPSKVNFREQRHNPMLKEPLLLTGYLEYIKPGHLGKVIETPFNEVFMVEDGKIEIQQKGKTRRLSLNRSKPLKAMLEGIEAVLAGHSEQLAEAFDYELTGSECDWTLRLVPKSKKIASHLSAMTVTGTDIATTSIRTDQGDGEWSLMDIVADAKSP